MAPPQGYRINKQSHRRSGNFGPVPIQTKVDIFAHTHFSPTDPTRGAQDREAAWLQAEKLDSPTLMVASLNKEADDWDCKDCSWKIRMLAGKFNLKFHTQASAAPTSHPAPSVHSPDIGSMQLDSPRSVVSTNIEDLRRETLNREVGNRQPYYGVHQALLDLSSGQSVTVHMRPSDKRYGHYDLKPGTIISAPFHSQYRQDTVTALDHNTGISAFGPVYSKYRKMIIIESWAEHVICLPIYTYNGRGLERRQGMVDEYMDIRDVEEEYLAPGDTHYEPLLAVRHEKWAGKNTFIAEVFHRGQTGTVSFQRMYKALLELTQMQALEVFGKPTESMIIMP